MIRIAVLDDYQGLARQLADWQRLDGRAEITTFERNLASVDEAAAALADFDVLALMRERMKIPRELIERLPKLKLITLTGARTRSIDMAAAAERGIPICTSGAANDPRGTAELAIALILACARHIPQEDRNTRAGRWQKTVGTVLENKTLGMLGLGKLGGRVAELGRAFRMDVLAWSENLTPERAAEKGATLVTKDELFGRSDFISVNLVLSPRTRGLVGAREIALMKPTATIVNTSRGPIIDEAALVAALRERRIRGAGLDVFETEPLPAGHPLTELDNVVLTPHLGFVTEGNYQTYYKGTLAAIEAWMGGKPINVLPPPAK